MWIIEHTTREASVQLNIAESEPWIMWLHEAKSCLTMGWFLLQNMLFGYFYPKLDHLRWQPHWKSLKILFWQALITSPDQVRTITTCLPDSNFYLIGEVEIFSFILWTKTIHTQQTIFLVGRSHFHSPAYSSHRSHSHWLKGWRSRPTTEEVPVGPMWSWWLAVLPKSHICPATNYQVCAGFIFGKLPWKSMN